MAEEPVSASHALEAWIYQQAGEVHHRRCNDIGHAAPAVGVRLLDAKVNLGQLT